MILPRPLHMPAVSRPRAPTSSNSAPLPATSTAGSVSPEEEIGRLDPVLAALADSGTKLAVDTYSPQTQRFALSRRRRLSERHQRLSGPRPVSGAGRGFVPSRRHARGRRHRARRAARSRTRRGLAAHRRPFSPSGSHAWNAAGIARERLILDPGMGLFLSRRPEASLDVLARTGRLKERFGLPVMISVSRKSFLGAITGRRSPGERGAGDIGRRTLRGRARRRLHPHARSGGAARRADRDGGAGRRHREQRPLRAARLLFGFDCGIAAGSAGRRDHGHAAAGRWRRDRDAGIDAPRRMEHAVGAVKFLAQRFFRIAAAAGSRVFGHGLRRGFGRGLLIDRLRAARPGMGQCKPGQYRRRQGACGSGTRASSGWGFRPETDAGRRRFRCRPDLHALRQRRPGSAGRRRAAASCAPAIAPPRRAFRGT